MGNLGSVLLAVVSLCLLAGCIFTPNQQHTTAFYDLQLPVKKQTAVGFRVSIFNNNTPSRTRMLYRKSSNQIIQDEYNCWMQPPERMLQRCMSLAYTPDNTVKELTEVRATVTAFEFDMSSHEAVLALQYQLKKNHRFRSGSIIVREKFAAMNPAEFASAMNRAMHKVCEKLADAAGKM